MGKAFHWLFEALSIDRSEPPQKFVVHSIKLSLSVTLFFTFLFVIVELLLSPSSIVNGEASVKDAVFLFFRGFNSYFTASFFTSILMLLVPALERKNEYTGVIEKYNVPVVCLAIFYVLTYGVYIHFQDSVLGVVAMIIMNIFMLYVILGHWIDWKCETYNPRQYIGYGQPTHIERDDSK